MKQGLLITLFVTALTLFLSQAHAADGPFEVVELTGQINGEPQTTQDSARASWNNSCLEWKKETKELNKNNDLLGINCNTPTCSFLDSGKSQCTSTGNYQVKTAGTRVDAQAPVVQSPPPPPVVVTTPAPQAQVVVQREVVVEEAPAPRIGFIWIPGFWGWHGHHHYWHGGYWRRHW